MSVFYIQYDTTQPNSFATLSEAIQSDLVVDGSTIYVQYDFIEPNKIVIDKSLTIIGRTNNTDPRPVIQILTNTDETSILCKSSNITLQGLYITDTSPIMLGDVCIYVPPGENNTMIYENFNLIDCQVTYTKNAMVSCAASFNVSNCVFYSVFTNSNHCAIYSQNNPPEVGFQYQFYTGGNVLVRDVSSIPDYATTYIDQILNKQILWRA